MPCAELPWPVHCLAYVQHGRTEKDGAGKPSTGYSLHVLPKNIVTHADGCRGSRVLTDVFVFVCLSA